MGKTKENDKKSNGKYPIPKVCRYCGGDVNLASNELVYGRKYGNGMCYMCCNCDAYVGVHPDLKTPLGILSNRRLRNLKKKAHSLFDPIWKDTNITRTQAYRILAKKLNISVAECHFGWFDEEMLRTAILILENNMLV